MTKKQAKRLARVLRLMFLDEDYICQPAPFSTRHLNGLWGVNVWMGGRFAAVPVFLESHHDAKRFCQVGPYFREQDARDW